MTPAFGIFTQTFTFHHIFSAFKYRHFYYKTVADSFFQKYNTEHRLNNIHIVGNTHFKMY